MKRSSPERIQDILDNIEKILSSTHNINLNEFNDDIVLQAAIIRWLEIIGEASKFIPQEIKLKYSDIPWKAIAGLRDVAIHDYAELVMDDIWQTVQKDIPVLKMKLEIIRHEENIF